MSKPVKTLTIVGASIEDVLFTMDARCMGEEITWNVTRIQRDADAGLFGNPIPVPMTKLPPATAQDDENIDWTKVDLFTCMNHVMNVPVLAIGSERGILCFVDGNHRICARRKAGRVIFMSYVVPRERERDYRVTMTTTGGE